jgi:sirohydrochlorin ferrochelatase
MTRPLHPPRRGSTVSLFSVFVAVVVLFVLLFIGRVAEAAPQTQAEQRRAGVLLLAHGSHAAPPSSGQAAASHAGHAAARDAPHAAAGHGHHSTSGLWNRNVEEVARELGRRFPTEVAFGMADPQSIQAAAQRLEAQGVQDIAVVPLFVSSHSPIIGNSRYILRLQPELAKTTRLRHLDRVNSTAQFRFASAMDGHAFISEILLDRARALAGSPAQATVVLVAHGPNDEEENRLWLQDMQSHARFLRQRGGFREVKALTHRNDAPAPVKAAARAAFRKAVADAARQGEVIVVPLLLSAGGIEREVEGDLRGLTYRFARPLMPHPNIARWAEAQAEALLGLR